MMETQISSLDFAHAGVQANVYHASSDKGEGREMAIKVYKTSILVFK